MNFYSQTKIQNTHTNSMKNFEFKSGKKNYKLIGQTNNVNKKKEMRLSFSDSND